MCGWLPPIEQPADEVSETTAVSAVKWVGASVAMVALGPVALVGGLSGMLAAQATGTSVAERRKRATNVGAVDGFPISDNTWALVTERAIWLGHEEAPFDRWVRAEIDESRSKKPSLFSAGREVLRVTRHTDYRTNFREIFKPRRIHEVTEEYVFTGKGARAAVRLAKLKLTEYALRTGNSDII